MRKIGVSLLVLVAVLSASCATKYQHKGFTGGYTDQQLQEDVFRVSSRVNGFSSEERAEDFTMYRACEVTLQHGFDYFVIVDSSDTTRTSYAGSGHADAYSYGNSTSVTYNQNINAVTKPGRMMVIKTFQGAKSKDNVNAYDARQTMNYLEASNKSIAKAKKGGFWRRLLPKSDKAGVAPK